MIDKKFSQPSKEIFFETNEAERLCLQWDFFCLKRQILGNFREEKYFSVSLSSRYYKDKIVEIHSLKMYCML